MESSVMAQLPRGTDKDKVNVGMVLKQIWMGITWLNFLSLHILFLCFCHDNKLHQL
jgi:hypothetical protein